MIHAAALFSYDIRAEYVCFTERKKLFRAYIIENAESYRTQQKYGREQNISCGHALSVKL